MKCAGSSCLAGKADRVCGKENALARPLRVGVVRRHARRHRFAALGLRRWSEAVASHFGINL